MLETYTSDARVAYFSMEIALDDRLPTYAGGLGVLAGDTLRSASDLALPVVAVTLASRQGHFRQLIDAAGRQTEVPDPWDPALFTTPLPARVAVDIEGRPVWVGGWLYELKRHGDRSQPVLLLDTDLEDNRPEDREITSHLYGGDNRYRLKQEIVLGLGGVRMLDALGFTVFRYHMNEGHSAFLGVELLRRHRIPAHLLRGRDSPYDLPRVRNLCCFTTHTPVEAGQDRFDYTLVREVMGEQVDHDLLPQLAGTDNLNMTCLALSLSEFVNGVAERHAEVAGKMYPGYKVHAITNGVHPFNWTAEPFRVLYDRHLPGWCHQPELLGRADYLLSPDDVRAARRLCQQALASEVLKRTGVQLDPARPTLGFARRFTAYKRPDLLFADLERLRTIARAHPFQIVMAGKAHPADEEGKRLIEAVHRHMAALAGEIPVAYLPNYDIALARLLVSGVDVWVNTPLPPLEASGTSGMKAAFNGVPSLSVLDGWWIEGCLDGLTGWRVGARGSDPATHGDALYTRLERDVLPLYHGDPAGWARVMLGAITKNAAQFNSHRMMRRYATEAYLA
ncbi:MAG: alpha-glucan family phosphorylase [Gammaproteobacteria bacterium]